MARTADQAITYVLRDPNGSIATPIIGIVRFNNERVKIATGFKILPTHWSSAKGRVKNVVDATDKGNINIWLTDTEKEVKAIISEMKANRIALTKESVKARLNAYLKPVIVAKPIQPALFSFIDKFIQTASQRINIHTGKPIGKRTIQKYNTTLTVLRDFARGCHRPIDFDTIDLEFYEAFTMYLTKNMNLAVNTVGKYIQTLKTFLNEAAPKTKALGIEVNPEYKNKRFKVLQEDADNIYLNEAELQKLFKLDLTGKAKLDRVRDLFLVGCWTGLRFSDFTAIRPEFISDGLIKMEQFKTKGKLVIPCHPIVEATLKKYNGVLPKAISNQKMNDYIKDLCKLANINQLVSKGITKGGERIIRTVEKWEFASTHTARRSFATNMYIMGVPTITIMKITGHKTEKAFMRYIKLDEEQHAQIIALHWQKQVANSPFKPS